MLDHDGPPRLDPAAARITTRPAFRKGFAAQMPGDGAPADAEAKGDLAPRPALAMECPHLPVLSLAPLVPRASQEPGSFLRLGGPGKKIAVPAPRLAAGPVGRAEGVCMGGGNPLPHPGPGLPQKKTSGGPPPPKRPPP